MPKFNFTEKSVCVVLPTTIENPFASNLFRALDLLSCSPQKYSRWSAALKHLQGALKRYHLLILDPTMKGFSAEKLGYLINKLPASMKPSIMLRTSPPDPNVWDLQGAALEEQFDSPAILKDDDTVYDMGFLLQHIFFPTVLNQRQHPRALTRLNVEFSVPSAGQRQKGTVMNISAGGAYIQSDSPLPEKSSLSLSLELPDAKPPIPCEGYVIFSHPPKTPLNELTPPGMGIRFQGLQSDDRDRIEGFVREHIFRIDQKIYYSEPRLI